MAQSLAQSLAHSPEDPIITVSRAVPIITNLDPIPGTLEVGDSMDVERRELVEQTREEMVKVFRRAGVKLHKVANWATKRRRRDILGLMIKSDVDLDKPDRSGWTPLGRAVMAGDRETVEMLVGAGASVTAPDGMGNTPLKYALMCRHRAIGKILRSHRAKNPNLQSDDDSHSSSGDSV